MVTCDCRKICRPDVSKNSRTEMAAAITDELVAWYMRRIALLGNFPISFQELSGQHSGGCWGGSMV